MGYLFVLLAVMSNEVNGYCGKKSSDYTAGFKDAMLFNAIRLGICVLTAFAITVIGGGVEALKLQKSDILCIIMSGVFNPIFLVSWLITIKTGAYLMVSVFLMMSVIVPALGSQVFFGEAVQYTQWIGFAILVAAALILCSYNNKIKAKLKLSDVILLLVCGLSCGLNDFSQKIFALNNSGTPVSTFNCYSFVISACVLLLCYFCIPKSKESAFSKRMPVNIVIYVIFMAICLFAYAFFQTQAAGYLPSAVIFPMTRGLSLIFAAVLAAIFFGERITGKCIAGIVLALVGILVINI